MPKILSIEDSDFERNVLSNIIEDEGHELVEAENGETGLEKYEEEDPDLVLLDLRLPDIDGLDVLEKLKDRDPNVKVVVVSIVREEETIQEAKDLGAEDYIEKPVDEDKLVPVIDEVL